MNHESIKNPKFGDLFTKIDNDELIKLYNINCEFIDFHERDKKFTGELLRITKVYSLIVGGFSTVMVAILLIASYYETNLVWNVVKAAIDAVVSTIGLGFVVYHYKGFRLAKTDPIPNYRGAFAIIVTTVGGSTLLSLAACIWAASVSESLQDSPRTFITSISAFNMVSSILLLIYTTRVSDSTEDQTNIKVNVLKNALNRISTLLDSESKRQKSTVNEMAAPNFSNENTTTNN